MALTLTEPPGFCDLASSALDADEIAFALHLGRIAKNAEMGIVRLEMFKVLALHGEQVALPVSRVDGEPYERSELLYFWHIRNTFSAKRGGNNPLVLTDPAGNITSTGWMSPSDIGQSLWFNNWNVQQYDPAQPADSEWNQKAGTAYSEIRYRESQDSKGGTQKTPSNDGILEVTIIAQRRKNSLLCAVEPDWTDIDETLIATNKAYRTDLLQQLLENSKYCCLNTEVFNLGEYVDGQTVSLVAAVSPADKHQYTFGETKLMHCWRWTARADAYLEPRDSLGQMGPFSCQIDPDTGAVSLYVDFINDAGALEQHPEFGRVAVFGFCTRDNGPTTITPTANQFRQTDDNFYGPGQKDRASTMLAIKRNIEQAVLTPEYFGPTLYADGETVPLPVSPVDGYEYSREELLLEYTWDNTINQVGNNLRLPLFAGKIDEATGLATEHVFRLPPGGPYVDDNNTLCRLKVLVVAFRGAELPELIDIPVNPPEDQPPVTAGMLLGSASDATVEIESPTDGSFEIEHMQTFTPSFAIIEMYGDGGNVWLDGAHGSLMDSTKLYLAASATGVKAKAFLFKDAPSAVIDLTPPDGPANFAVTNTLNVVPGLVIPMMTTGGNIWSQPNVADASLLYFTKSLDGVTAKAALWIALTGDATPSVNHAQIPIPLSTAPGPFQLRHELGVPLKNVFIHMNAPGFPNFWFQDGVSGAPDGYDDLNIYLVAPDAGVSGFAEVLY